MLHSTSSRATACSPPMTKRPKDSPKHGVVEEVPGQAARLKRLRDALEFETAIAFAAFLDIDYSRYSAFENGSPLSRQVAFILVQKISGLTLDWLYFGKTDGLSIELARRLGVFDPPGKRSTA